MLRPVVLCIAGSDCSAGAGIQADLRAVEAAGGRAATVITAVTAQDGCSVSHVQLLPVETVRAQIDAVCGSLPVAAVKTGMLGSSEIVAEVVRAVDRFALRRVVCDPVMEATVGRSLLSEEGRRRLRSDLLPRVRVVTPNPHEAALLAGVPVVDAAGAEEAGRRLLALGAGAVVVTGGDLDGRGILNTLVQPGGVTRYEYERVPDVDTHGTGCSFSSSLATTLARGLSLERAVEEAGQLVAAALRRQRARAAEVST